MSKIKHVPFLSIMIVVNTVVNYLMIYLGFFAVPYTQGDLQAVCWFVFLIVC